MMTIRGDVRGSMAVGRRRYGVSAAALLMAFAPGCGGTVEEQSVHWIEPLPEHAAAARKDGGDAGTVIFGVSPDGHRALARSDWTGPTRSESAMVFWDQEQGTRALGTLSGWVIDNVFVSNRNLTTMLGANTYGDFRSFRWTKDAGVAEIPIRASINSIDDMFLSDDGEVGVVSVTTQVDFTYHVFRIDSSATAVDIGAPEGFNQGVTALYLSPDGKVIWGEAWVTSAQQTTQHSAFSWSEDLGFQVIPWPDGNAQCAPVNVFGVPEVGVMLTTDCVGYVNGPLAWTSKTGWFALGAVASERSVIAVDRHGTTVIGDRLEGNEMVPWRWTQQGGMSDAQLPQGQSFMEYKGLSDDGAVVAGNLIGSPNRAFVWTADSNPTLLPILPGHGDTFVGSISADGSMLAGASVDSDASSSAVLWVDGKLQLVANVLSEAGVSLGDARLVNAYIDSAGNVLSGDGKVDGKNLAWVARVPGR